MIRNVILLAACLVLIAGFSLAGGDVKTSSSPAGEGSTKKFTLIYNVNNAGYIDVCGCKHKEVRQGSITRRASFLRQYRGTGQDVLLLDGGSALFPVRERVKDPFLAEATRKANLIVAAYNRMGYHAMAVGAFDLAAGLDVLQDLEKKAKFKMLSANVVDKESGKLLFQPWEIFNIGGVRVGVFGLTLETLTRPYLEKVAPNIRLEDPLERAKQVVAELKDKTDLVIALSHIRDESNFALAKQLEDLEIILDPNIEYGNHHTWIKPHEWTRMMDGKLFLRSDGQGARLGVVEIEFTTPHAKLVDFNTLTELEDAVQDGTATAEQKAELASAQKKNKFEFTRVSIEPHHLTDPEINLLIDEWKKGGDLGAVARLEQELPEKEKYLTVETCRSCHEAQHDFWAKTKHATAYQSLVATSDENRFDCIGCHSLGYGRAFLDTTKIGAYANVQCESCHGVNPQHPEAPKAHKFGKLKRDNCLLCHNKEQTLKDFNFFNSKRLVACPKG